MKIGSLFSGVAGLDRAVESFFDAEVAWFVEFDAAPSKVLAHHYPGVPNYGDVTAVDWATVEPIDILTGGFPCQDVSLAGARKGLGDGTRSGLWSEYAAAIDILRPKLVVIENVRGLLSAQTIEEVEDAPDSDSEHGPAGVGEPPRGDRPVLNAFGRVLLDLAELGYDAEWVGLRAADAGAPHNRFRVFVVAHPKGDRWNEGWTESARLEGRHDAALGGDAPSDATSVAGRIGHGDDVQAGGDSLGRGPNAGRGAAEDPDVAVGGERRLPAPGQEEGGRARADAGRRSGTPAADTDRGRLEIGSECNGESEQSELEASRRVHADGHSVANSSGIGLQEGRLPGGSAEEQPESSSRFSVFPWGVYEPAIRQWEQATRRAPDPTTPDGRDGKPRLNPEFVTWMMGWPAGWVTDPAIGLTRNEQLKACGNGVVTQQAYLALSVLMGRAA